MLKTIKISKQNYAKFQNNQIYIDLVFSKIVHKNTLYAQYNEFLKETKEELNLDDYVAKYTCLFSCYDINFLENTNPSLINITKTKSSVIISVWLDSNVLDKTSRVYQEVLKNDQN